MEKQIPLEERAATALDLTHAHDNRGPKTYLARQRVATALDSGKHPNKADIQWLEHVVELGFCGQCEDFGEQEEGAYCWCKLHHSLRRSDQSSCGDFRLAD